MEMALASLVLALLSWSDELKKLAISQSDYIPWKGYFDLIRQVDIFVLFDSVQYTRRDWRNRNKIVEPNGNLIWLSIPVQTKGKYLANINEIETVDQGWRKQHFETIRNCYRQAPYYQAMIDIFEELYLLRSETSLSAINRHFIERICGLLNIKTKIEIGQSYPEEADANDKLLIECKRFGANSYMSGPSAAAYLDRDKFNRQGIDIEWMSYTGYPEYNQSRVPFEHQVSIVDLLFNHGQDAQNYLNKL